MIGSVGDLLEDVVVNLHGPVNLASDTDATITRRRGGSAANVVAAVAAAGVPARFIGQVGADAVGDRLVSDLVASGAEVVGPRRGRTGTVVALVDATGERTMLADRGDATELSDPDPAWVAGLRHLHVPFYSLSTEPLAPTSLALVARARSQGVSVSVDASSVAVLDGVGRAEALDRLAAVAPDVLFANEMEAAWLGEDLMATGAGSTVVKQGARPAVLVGPGGDRIEVPARPIDPVLDTTGAGDAFAGGYLVAMVDGEPPERAAESGHRAAAAHITARTEAF